LNSEHTYVDYTDGLCFHNITFSFTQTGSGDDMGDAILTVTTKKQSSLLCKDWFFFGTTEFFHQESFFKKGTHTVKFTNLSPDAKIDIAENGIKVYMMCDGYIDTFISALHMAEAFLGGLGTNPNRTIFGSHVPEYMERENI